MGTVRISITTVPRQNSIAIDLEREFVEIYNVGGERVTTQNAVDELDLAYERARRMLLAAEAPTTSAGYGGMTPEGLPE